MTKYKSLMEITADEWLQAMNLPATDIPDAVIIEGSWWRQQRTDWRLSYLSNVRELEFPDIFLGDYEGRKIAFCCAYGAARAVEIIHLFGILGTKLAVQIGTCGGLQPHLKPGDIVVPDMAIAREGIAHLYGTVEAAPGTEIWLDRSQQALEKRKHTVYRGTHLTWSSIFAQNGQMIDEWHRSGYVSVDMETATTYAVARHFNMEALSMLVVWDDLTRGRSFLDPLTEGETAALNRANKSIFEVGLEMAQQ